MLFIVPDADDKPTESASSGGIKVELDLDDAPFLEEDEPEPKPSEPEKEPEPKDEPQPPAKGETPAGKGRLAGLLANKKRLIIIGGSAAVLIVLAVVVNVFLFGEEKPKAPEKPAPIYEVIPSTPPEEGAVKPPYAHLVQWDTFLVERRGEDGGLRFITCKIAIPAADDVQYMELMAKQVVLRDAVYYFLSNRPPEILSTPEKNRAMRDDIVGVLNGHLTTEVKDVYIEEYLVSDPNRP